MTKTLILGTSFVAIAVLLSVSLIVIGTSQASAQPPSKNFVAPLEGAQENPPVATKATGLAKFQLNKAGTALNYKLIVANINQVTQAHIHCNGPPGVNGPVSVFLFGFVAGGVTTNGILAQGSISTGSPGFTGACGINTLNGLLTAMRSGNTYVNVHTVANPPGEIRGQIAEAGP